MNGLNTFLQGVLVGAEALAPVLPILAGALGTLMTALAPVIAMLVPSLGVTITGLAVAFAAIVSALSPFLTELAAMLPVLIPLGLAFMVLYKGLLLFQQVKAIVDLIRSLTAVQWLWNAAMAANPIGIVILAIAALVAGLIWFFTQTELGRQIWGGFVNWLSEVIGGFLNWWNGTAVPWLQQGFAAIVAMIQVFVGIWQAAWQAVWSFIQMVVAIIVSIVTSWVNQIMANLAALGALGAMAWNWFMGMVTSAINAGAQLLAFVAGIPGQVMGFLGNLGSLLIGAGQSLIQGFIDGISSMIGAVGKAVGGVMDFVGSFFPHSPAKRGEFSGKGWTPFRGKALMTGFADGISSGQQSGADAAASATTAISNQLHPVIDPSRALSGAPVPGTAATPLRGSTAQPLNASTGGDRHLNVTVNNPAKEAPSTSIQKTYSKIAYLGLDAGDDAA
jgi:phage-related protein